MLALVIVGAGIDRTLNFGPCPARIRIVASMKVYAPWKPLKHPPTAL
jgi:hypothetical protein